MDKKLTIELSEEQMAHFVSNGSLTIILKQTIKMDPVEALKAQHEEPPKKKEPKEDPEKIARDEALKAQEKKERLVAEYCLLPENEYLSDLDWNKCIAHVASKGVKIKRNDKIILTTQDGKTTVLWEELITGKSTQSNKNKKGKPYSKKQQKLVDAWKEKYPKALRKSERQTTFHYNESSFRNSVFASLQVAVKAAANAGNHAVKIDYQSNEVTSTDALGVKWFEEVVTNIVEEQGEDLEYDAGTLMKSAKIAVTNYVAAKAAESNFFVIATSSTMFIIADGFPEVETDTYDEVVN